MLGFSVSGLRMSKRECSGPLAVSGSFVSAPGSSRGQASPVFSTYLDSYAVLSFPAGEMKSPWARVLNSIYVYIYMYTP